MDFGPKNIFKGTNSDGKPFRFEEWDYSTLAGADLLNISSQIFVGIFIGCITSPMLAFKSITGFDGNLKVINIIGIILSVIFLYQCYSGGIILTALNILLSEGVINFLVCINIVGLVIHILLLFSGVIHYVISTLFKTEDARIQCFVILLFVVCVLSYKITRGNLKQYEGWVDHNINANLVGYTK